MRRTDVQPHSGQPITAPALEVSAVVSDKTAIVHIAGELDLATAPQLSPRTTPGPRTVNDLDDLQRLTRAARVQAAYLRSISLDIHQQRHSPRVTVPRDPRHPLKHGGRSDQPSGVLTLGALEPEES